METGTPIVSNSSERRNGSRARVWALTALRIVATLLLFYALTLFVSLNEVADAFLSARFEYIAVALLLGALNLGLQLMKWRYFTRLANPAGSHLETIASLLFGITVGVITPGQLGELGGRALRHHSVSAAKIIGLTLIDKFQMLLIMGIGGVVSYVVFFSLSAWYKVMIVGVVWILFTYLFFRPSIIGGMLRLAPSKIRQHPWTEDIRLSLSLLKPKDLLFAFCVTLSYYGVVYVQMYLLLNAFSSVNWWETFLGFAAMMFLKSVIPISFGDLGLREASSVYFYSQVGIPEAAALNASLLLFFINIAIPALLGLLFIPKFPRPLPEDLKQEDGSPDRTG